MNTVTAGPGGYPHYGGPLLPQVPLDQHMLHNHHSYSNSNVNRYTYQHPQSHRHHPQQQQNSQRRLQYPSQQLSSPDRRSALLPLDPHYSFVENCYATPRSSVSSSPRTLPIMNNNTSSSPTSSVASAGNKRRRRDESTHSPPGATVSPTASTAAPTNGTAGKASCAVAEGGAIGIGNPVATGNGGVGAGVGASVAGGASGGGRKSPPRLPATTTIATTTSATATAPAPATSGVGGSSSSFRNVSACNRCRLRKNRCDQRLPACLSCEKASVRCVGYDPITKREIPRSYVHYLETRLAYLESLLSSHRIAFAPADEFPDLPPLPASHNSATSTPTTATAPHLPALPRNSPPQTPVEQTLALEASGRNSPSIKRESPSRDVLGGTGIENLVSDIGLVSFAGASDPRYLGSVSGISFARVVFAAVKSTTKEDQGTCNDPAAKSRHRRTTSSAARGTSTTKTETATTSEDCDDAEQASDADMQMRDSFFGLHTKPTISPAPFPSRPVADRLINLYFEHANPQIPSLHRGEYQKIVEEIYGPVDSVAPNEEIPVDYGVAGTALGGSARDRYMLHIICAIGAGIFLTGPNRSEDEGGSDGGSVHEQEADADEPRKKQKVEASARADKPTSQHEPEAYHASAMHHLEAFLRESKGGLEELQAVLLLAAYALLRPVAPGLWYIVGVALRLAVDLGLHYEDAEAEARPMPPSEEPKTEKQGKKEWVRDLRRRLWWCVYSLDRLVATCVGRPFGIADEVISTQFPSTLDDEYIHPTKGLMTPPPGVAKPSYKLVSHHYFRLRLLQSEILQVLQQQSHTFSFASASSEHEFKRDNYKGKKNYPAHHPYHLQTPYLHKHTSLQAWHRDVDRRLLEWIQSAPKTKAETGVSFSPEFLELNYWQAKIMLYRPCLSVPVLLAGELSANHPTARSRAAEKGMGASYAKIEDEERVYLVVAEAGSKVLRLYRQLHRIHQVNYTFLATHHLFMAGISFLYAIWHSPLVRSKLSMDEVDFTILAATSVLGDLVSVCPPAEACKEAFERMSRATVQMCLSGAKWLPPGSNTETPTSSSSAASVIKTPAPRKRQSSAAQLQPQYFPPLNHHPTPPPPQQRVRALSHPHDHSYHQQQPRRPVHFFDDGFRELFTSPQQQHRQFSPTQQQYNEPQYYQQQVYQQPQQYSEWQPGMQEVLGLGADWEMDTWSEEGVEGQQGNVDLFDGFFFGGAGGN